MCNNQQKLGDSKLTVSAEKLQLNDYDTAGATHCYENCSRTQICQTVTVIDQFAQLLPGLETGHPVTVGQTPAYESHSEQSETETRKTAFCSSGTLKSYAGD